MSSPLWQSRYDSKPRGVRGDFVKTFLLDWSRNFYNHFRFPYRGRQILLKQVTIYVMVSLIFCKFFRMNLIIVIYYQLVKLLSKFC